MDHLRSPIFGVEAVSALIVGRAGEIGFSAPSTVEDQVTTNAEQLERWNGYSGSYWADHAERYDRQLAPYRDLLIDRVAAMPGNRVLDVGCGCGIMSLTLATQVAQVTGVDLSEPMLAEARRRTTDASLSNVELIHADAQTHPFDDGSFDVIVSRFGVMFFDDPTAAFANLRTGLVPGGRLTFVCWQSLEHNQWLDFVTTAAAPHVPIPTEEPGQPGPMSLADPDRIWQVLGDAGYRDVSIESHEPTISVGGGASVEDTVAFLANSGYARLLLHPAPPEDRVRVLEDLHAVLDAHHEPGDGVRAASAGWLVTAVG